MAKFVIAGKADCPLFAKSEKIALYLAENLANFHVKIIAKHPDDWTTFLNKMTSERSWKHSSSPIIWRDFGGELDELVGSETEFSLIVLHYYGISTLVDNDLIEEIRKENFSLCKKDGIGSQ